MDFDEKYKYRTFAFTFQQFDQDIGLEYTTVSSLMAFLIQIGFEHVGNVLNTQLRDSITHSHMPKMDGHDQSIKGVVHLIPYNSTFKIERVRGSHAVTNYKSFKKYLVDLCISKNLIIEDDGKHDVNESLLFKNVNYVSKELIGLIKNNRVPDIISLLYLKMTNALEINKGDEACVVIIDDDKISVLDNLGPVEKDMDSDDIIDHLAEGHDFTISRCLSSPAFAYSRRSFIKVYQKI